MAIELLLQRERNALAAADPISAEALQEIAHGEVVNATIRRARNPRHHRLFFAMLKLVFDNQMRYATIEQLLDAVKINTGYFELYTLPGKVPVQILRPKSINFASMDQKSFSDFYNKAIEWILSELLPGLSDDDLEMRVLEMIGEKKP